jgi:antitoxin VapB
LSKYALSSADYHAPADIRATAPEKVGEDMTQDIVTADLYRLIQNLADRTGESLTTAVTIAVQERSDKLKQDDEQRQRIEAMREIVREIAPFLKDTPRYWEVDELHYDERGLPK